ncbi:MAG: hypothetical protein M1819_005645 [Sarea resinae]|nr:MAG: hypothetical protein M1819_005645 [Sarea resinae]
MFQCLGLGSVEDGGCGEDWWHPECLLGLEHKVEVEPNDKSKDPTAEADSDDDPPLPPGFPAEDAFESFICYKCVESHPWIKRYAGSTGFLPPVYKKDHASSPDDLKQEETSTPVTSAESNMEEPDPAEKPSSKRKAEDDEVETSSATKRQKGADEAPGDSATARTCTYETLPPAPTGTMSLFLNADFREHFCRCRACFPKLSPLPQLLEEEETYEPPLSESDEGDVGTGSVGTGSLLDRGEAALSNVDRVRAIEGVMVYNHLKDKVKSFLQPFAESGQAVGAEDIKQYFEKLRGDAEAIKAAGGGPSDGSGGEGDDQRREQEGM